MRERGLWLAGMILGALLFALLVPENLFRADAAPLEPPSTEHWFGTDDLGRDVLEGIVLGARLSLLVGLATAVVALLLGTLVGITAGYAGGWSDEALLRVVEFFQVLPRFFVALAVLTIFGGGAPLLVLVLGLTSWSGLARLARAETLSLREREFVVSARASGAPFVHIVRRHLAPNLASPLLAATPLVAGQAMLTEAGLSFLGIATSSGVSWGYLLQNAQPFLREAWWMAVFPGLAITTTILVLSLASMLGRRRSVGTTAATLT